MTEQSSSQPSTPAQGATAGGHPVLERLRGGLIASAQAYPGEPMRDPRTMDQVAQACVAGGAVGIRAQGLADLALICQHVDVPVIGLWKDGHDGVFITPTLTHAIAVAATGSQIVALDGTRRPRPDGLSLAQTVEGLRAARPEVLIMADCGSLHEAKAAPAAGVDILGTTLAGYTGERPKTDGPDLELVDQVAGIAEVPLVVEGRVHTPAQAAAALSEASDAATDEAEAPSSDEQPSEEETTKDEVAVVGGAAAEASAHSPSSRRSMIFGDDETLSSSIPAVAAEEENAPAETSAEEEPEAEEEAPFTEPTTQLPTQDTEASYSFEDQDAAEAARPRRRSLLGQGDEDSEAATLAAIAATTARGDKSDAPSSLDDELFSAAPEITEMPSRTGAHWLSFLLFLLLVPAGWYLAADAGARMTLADAAPMYTGVASIVALGEILGAIVISAILFVTARRSSLGAWLMGIVTLIVGLPWLMAPGITGASVLSALTALTNTGSLGANLSHHLQASGYSGRFVLLGIVLMGLAYVSHSARRTGRAEEALRVSLEATNPAGAFYSKRARKKAAKEAARK